MLAIIGGSGLYELSELGEPEIRLIDTEYDPDAVAVSLYSTASDELAFLPRHGPGYGSGYEASHSTPPHRVNYRANIAALAELGVTQIVAVNAVGGINAHAGPGSIVVPTQIIDYTWGRQATFFEDNLQRVVHIDFTQPFSAALSESLLTSVYRCADANEETRTVLNHGTYGCTQGPRLETAAEIRRMKQDGCDIVGMTAMPEAALAREKELDYAMLALSVNWAAGTVPGLITMDEIRRVMEEGIGFLRKVLVSLLTEAD